MMIQIEVFGEVAISRQLMRVGERAEDASPAFEEIAKMFYDSEKMQFDTEGEWGSGGWTPLAQSTVLAKLHGGFRPNILQRTGALMDSLTDDNADYAVKEINQDSMFSGSNIPYGVFHQQAQGHGMGMIPMRKPVELPEKTKRDMVKALQNWVMHGGEW